MTAPELADRTYIEPVTPEWVERVIARERPDALLPTMGGQTALNVAMALHENGVLAEDRGEFAAAMKRIGKETSDWVKEIMSKPTKEERRQVLDQVPVRPSHPG